jgi:hypothetical protein
MFTNVSETPDLLQQTLQAIHTAANVPRPKAQPGDRVTPSPIPSEIKLGDVKAALDKMKAARSTNMVWSGYNTVDWSGCDEVEQVEGKLSGCRFLSTPVCRLTSFSTTIKRDFLSKK